MLQALYTDFNLYVAFSEKRAVRSRVTCKQSSASLEVWTTGKEILPFLMFKTRKEIRCLTK